MKNLKITNPKRNATSRRGWQGFFPYYAGFSEQFAREIIGSAALPAGAVVWDPWNGSGTTTSAADSLGINGRGTDINPVMVIVAKARLLPVTEVDSLLSLTREVIASAGRSRAKLRLDDPLLSWFDPDTSTYLRNLERSIRTLLVGERTIGKAGTDLTELSTIASAMYVALFTTAREAVNHAKTSNPTWLRKPGGQLSVAVLNRQSFAGSFQSNVTTMINSMDGGLAPVALTEPRPTVTIEPGDTASMDASNLQADFVLTSPPYCTRIDYAAATRVELAFVEPWQTINAHQLSRMMIGSTRVPLDVPAPLRDWGSTCIAFLKKVRDHDRKHRDPTI
jgi:hypothetical protein